MYSLYLYVYLYVYTLVLFLNFLPLADSSIQKVSRYFEHTLPHLMTFEVDESIRYGLVVAGLCLDISYELV